MNIIRYRGNKHFHIENYLKHIPSHKLYVEPFFGSGAMFINKDLAHFSLLNDFNYLIYNFFKCLNYDVDKFIFKLRNTYYTQEILNEFTNDLHFYEKKPEPDFDLAVKLFIVLRKTMKGSIDKVIGFSNIIALNKILSNNEFFIQLKNVVEKFRKSIICNFSKKVTEIVLLNY